MTNAAPTAHKPGTRTPPKTVLAKRHSNASPPPQNVPLSANAAADTVSNFKISAREEVN